MRSREELESIAARNSVSGILADLTSSDEHVRKKAETRARNLDHFGSWQKARVPSWSISEADAHRILSGASDQKYPLPPKSTHWIDGYAQLLSKLWRSPYDSLVPLVPDAYAECHDGRRRTFLLTILSIVATRPAALAFMRCTREYGWPQGGGAARFTEELEKLFAFPDVMLPEAVLGAGALASEVGEALLNAVASGRLNVADSGEGLQAIAPFVFKTLKKELKSAAKYQTKPGISWRFAERYHYLRYRIGSFLDLAGHLSEERLLDLLEEAATFTDPRLVSQAVLSLLRRDKKAPQRAIKIAAGNDESRAIFWNGLVALGRERIFPEKWRTWEAFGAAAMVEWLLYPAELGRAPDEIELGHTEWLDRRRKIAVFVWRFRVGKDPWLAGVTAPLILKGKPKPVSGALTFSCFEEWDRASPLEHLEKCAGTASEIMKAATTEN